MPERGPFRSVEDLGAGQASGSSAPMPIDEDARKAVVAAYGFLGRRPYSRRELGQKLKRHVESADAISAALDWLEARHLLDDRQLAHDAVQTAGSRRGWGRRKVQQWLQTRGIDGDVAAEAVAEITPEDEATQAIALAERQRARGRRPDQVFRFLVTRGFPAAVARRASLEGPHDE